MHTLLTPAALGPVWPILLLLALFMAATTAFLFFTRRRQNYAPDEARFLRRLYDATDMCCMLALFTGVLGTCLHLLELLPELNRVLHDANAKLAPRAAAQLRTMWASAIAGLFIGGLWGETLRFFIKPRLRDQPCFIIKRAAKRRPSKPKPAASQPEPDLDQAWQAKDAQGIY
jgi:hypothetical protein